jgi:hypothetical protein
MSEATASGINTIFISLHDEGTTVLRPTQGQRLRNGLYEVLPTSDYEPDDEHWEFPPGSVVRCVTVEHEGEKILVAKELASQATTPAKDPIDRSQS